MNGNLKNCPSCGKLFIAQPKQRLCMDCFEKQREEEERIICYVNAHPEVTMRSPQERGLSQRRSCA